MESKQVKWLRHIVDAIPDEAKRNQISMYTIALEGWRRGLTLKFYSFMEENKRQVRYSLSNGTRIHYFNGSSGDKVLPIAFEICEDKNLTSEYLENAGVPVPRGRTFYSETSDQQILSSVKDLSYPLVVKPVNGKAGRGVMANINTGEDLKAALQYVREELEYPDVIIQEFVQGEEVRIYVLDGKVLAAVNRRPANIVGDGTHRVKELIEIKNEVRRKVPHLQFKPIHIDREVKSMLDEAGYTYDSIPEKGKIIYLRKISNVSRGGEPVDITDKLTQTQKQIAIAAVDAIPGLPQCGVDMIIDSKGNESVILELNTRPGIGSHLFPTEGETRDISKEIVDFYFPETKGMKTSDSNVFFDFGSIVRALRGNSINEIEVFPRPKTKLYAMKYTIKGNLEGKEFYLWLKARVLQNDLHGFLKMVDQDCFELVIAGESEEVVDGFRTVWEDQRGFKVHIVKMENWSFPIKLGFYWEDGYNSMPTRELELLLNEREKELKRVGIEVHRLGKLNGRMKTSSSWRLTFPIRKTSELFKKNRNKNKK